MKYQINKNELVQVQGLLALAEDYYNKLKECEVCIEELLEIEDRGQHSSIVSDAIYGSEVFNARQFCKDNLIKIK